MGCWSNIYQHCSLLNTALVCIFSVCIILYIRSVVVLFIVSRATRGAFVQCTVVADEIGNNHFGPHLRFLGVM